MQTDRRQSKLTSCSQANQGNSRAPSLLTEVLCHPRKGRREVVVCILDGLCLGDFSSFCPSSYHASHLLAFIDSINIHLSIEIWPSPQKFTLLSSIHPGRAARLHTIRALFQQQIQRSTSQSSADLNFHYAFPLKMQHISRSLGFRLSVVCRDLIMSIVGF